MKTIAFYISNHGFGHASRNIPIIENICKNYNNVNVIIKTGKEQLKFMQQSLNLYNSKIDFHICNADTGLILKDGTMDVNKEELYEQLEGFQSSWDTLIEEEKMFLLNNNINLVVSDIVSWIFKACDQCSITSILISNFTWVEIYRELGFEDIAENYKSMYNLANKLLVYPLSTGIEKELGDYEKVGLSVRSFDERKIKLIKRNNRLPMVYVSVGRSVDIKESIDVSSLPYNFIYTDGISLKGENTKKLPKDTLNTHDYLKACDFIITKAGWGTVAEAMAAKKPMLVLRRDDVFEDKNTLHKLVNLKVALPILFKELNKKDIERLLYELQNKKIRENYKFLCSECEENSETIADTIIKSIL